MEPLAVVREMKIVGQSPRRWQWLVKPIRWVLFPFIRPYFQYLAEHIIDDSLLLSNLETKVDSLDVTIKKALASTTQYQDVSNRLQVVEGYLQNYLNYFDEKDYMATIKRLSEIEDMLAQIANQLELVIELPSLKEAIATIQSQANASTSLIEGISTELKTKIDDLDEIKGLITRLRGQTNRVWTDLMPLTKVNGTIMPMVSYAQNNEDVLLDRVFKGQSKGFYIDIGASLPIDHSTTYHFYKQGWSGINVEPIPHLFKRLLVERLRDINLCCAVSETNEVKTFYEVTNNLGRSSLEANIAKAVGDQEGLIEYKVPVVTLNDIFSKYSPNNEVDFLKIDVEGLERSVILGNNWGRNRPRVIVVEAINPVDHIPDWEKWEYILLENRYIFVHFDGLNRYYLREEDIDLKDRFQVPVNVLDNYISVALYEANLCLNNMHFQLTVKSDL
jgi:FkbM family methyltransferase